MCAMLVLVAVAVGAAAPAEVPAPARGVPGLAMYGSPAYEPGFAHFAYVSPDAPKGGDVVLAAIGTFDTLNPYTLRGVAAAGIAGTFDTLMVASADEPFSEYGLIAETVETPADRSWVTFTLRREARFHAMGFEILLSDPSFERIALHFAKALERLGIEVSVRTVDSAQYEHRLEHFDFDMTVAVWPQSLSPGNEQIDYWTSARASEPGSRNLAGVRDPVVDRLVAALIAAPDRASLVARIRALDRVLLFGHYVIPHWHVPTFRVAYWNKFGYPPVSPPYALGFETWWIEPARAARAR